jgi:hypothetical protein
MNVKNLIIVVISEQVPFLHNNFSKQFLRAHESYFRAEILIRIVLDEAYAIRLLWKSVHFLKFVNISV